MYRIIKLSLFFLTLITVNVAAQTAPKLVLETTPDSTEISLKDSVTISSDGTITATPVDGNVCQATESCEGVTVSVTSFDSPSEQSGTITVNEGSSFELTWRSSGATACQALGDFQPWVTKGSVGTDSRDVSSSSRTLSANGAAGASPYELKLQCSNGTVSSTVGSGSTLNLVVNEVVPPSPTSCDGREPIAGWQRLTTGSLSCVYGDSSADCRNWDTVWPSSFLATTSLTRKILTNKSGKQQYVAIGLSTAGMSNSATGGFNFTSAGGEVSKQPIIATISKCRGDFNAVQPSGCYFHHPFNNFKWRAPQSSDSASCVLEPNSTYYLNILSSNSPSGTLPANIQPIDACDNSLCGILIQKR